MRLKFLHEIFYNSQFKKKKKKIIATLRIVIIEKSELTLLPISYFNGIVEVNGHVFFKDKYICYFYKGRQISEFNWSHISTTRNTEDMESQGEAHLRSNCNPLVFRVKPSSYACSNCDGFFIKTGRIVLYVLLSEYPMLKHKK